MNNILYLRTLSIIHQKKWYNRLPFHQYDRYLTFAILCHPRTGSTLLHTLLNAHPQVLSWGEALMNRWPEDNKILDRVTNDFYHRSIQAVGCKLFYQYGTGHSGWDIIDQLTARKPIKVIHLYRKNLLRTIVSLELAKETRQPTVWVARQHLDLVDKRIYIDPQECMKRLRQLSETFQWYQRALSETDSLLVSYEELTTDQPQTLARVQQFLEVDTRRLFSLLQKQNPEPLSELVVNYAALNKALSGTSWATYLTE